MSPSPESAAAAVADVVVRPVGAEEKEPVPNVSAPGGAPCDGADGSGWLPLGFDPSVIDTLSTLYGKWTSGLRELYANMVASCKRAEREYGASPTIRIAVDGRRIVLEDVDSCGMSQRVFRDGIAVAGNSGNYDPLSPGQWGLGSLSFVMLADTMLIESHSRATGERFAAEALRGGRFRTAGLPEPDFDWHGTRMTLVLRDGLEVKTAIETIVDLAEMSGVETILTLYGREIAYAVIDGKWESGEYGWVWHSRLREYRGRAKPAEDRPGVVVQLGGGGMLGIVAAAIERAGHDAGLDGSSGSGSGSGSNGSRPRKRARTARRGAKKLDDRCLLRAGRGVAVFHAENDEIGFAAAHIFSGHVSRMSYNREDLERGLPNSSTWLAGMPIEGNPPGCIAHGMDTALVHCKNERRYKPTPDRERLADGTPGLIGADVEALAKDALSRVRYSSLGEYLADYSNRVVEASLHMAQDCTRHHVEDKSVGIFDCEENYIVPRRMRRIAAAASEPIHAFSMGGSGGSSEVQTLWSAVQCPDGGCDDGDGRPHRCSMPIAGGGKSGPDGPILIVAPVLAVRKAVAVLEHCEKSEPGRRAVVFRPNAKNRFGVDEYAELGAEHIDEYMKRHGIRPIPADKARRVSGRRAASSALVVYGGEFPDDARLMSAYRSFRSSRKIKPGDADENVVWCRESGDMNAMKSIVSVVQCRTQAAKCARLPGRATPFACYAEAGGRAVYSTSAGRISGAAIAATGRKAVLIEYDGDAAGLAVLIGVAANAAAAELSSKGGDGGGRRRVQLHPGIGALEWHGGNVDRYAVSSDRPLPLAVVGRAPELASCAAFLHSSGSEYGVWIPSSLCYGSGPEYVQRATAWVGECLPGQRKFPEWLDYLSPRDVDRRQSRTLVASALHGFLLNEFGGGATSAPAAPAGGIAQMGGAD